MLADVDVKPGAVSLLLAEKLQKKVILGGPEN